MNEYFILCENCLPQKDEMKMTRIRNGEACKICDRPFDLYKWRMEHTPILNKTEICLTCAKIKNVCQCCLKDTQFDIPYYIRDAALSQISTTEENHFDNLDIQMNTLNAVNRQWLIDQQIKQYEEKEKNEYEEQQSSNIETIVNQLEKKHNMSNGFEPNQKLKKKNSNSNKNNKNDSNGRKDQVKKVFIEKKPKKEKSFLK